MLPLLLILTACTVSPDDPFHDDDTRYRDEREPLVWEISNPYASVDWKEYGRYKANFHTHTTVSDGVMNPHTVVDRYLKLGYDILAITDHNAVTYPWTGFSKLNPSVLSINRRAAGNLLMPEKFSFEDRDQETLAMIAIEGNEYSRHHHIGGYFSNIPGSASIDESLQKLGDDDGIAMLFHPGRYTPPLQWYVDLYLRYDHLFGMEVYNQGDRYPGDRHWWDLILSETMPGRPVWGYSNDDMHTAAHLGYNWNIMLLPELTSEHVRTGMTEGTSWFVYAPQGHTGPSPPQITRVITDRYEGTISLSAEQYESITWLAHGNVVGENLEIALDSLPADTRYVRAELHGREETVTGTQPFGIRRLEESTAD